MPELGGANPGLSFERGHECPAVERHPLGYPSGAVLHQVGGDLAGAPQLEMGLEDIAGESVGPRRSFVDRSYRLPRVADGEADTELAE